MVYEGQKSIDKAYPNWSIVGTVGQGSIGSVYRIMQKDSAASHSQYSCALKVVSIPQSDHIYSRMISELGGPNNVKEYLKGIVAAIDKELKQFESSLSLGKNTVSYLDHRIIPHDNDYGYDILIRMEYLNSFSKFILQNRPDEEKIIRLGIDLCESLQAAERMKIVHRNIKPENIFISSSGAFMLGDYCMSSIVDVMTFSPVSAGSTYTAPEVYRKELYDNRADIYSLGLLMYRLLNENRDPFMASKGKLITYEARNAALSKRLTANFLPDPVHGSPELKEIIKKACAGEPAIRFANAGDMKAALIQLARAMEKEKEAEAKARNLHGQPVDIPKGPDKTGGKVGTTVCYKKQGPIRYLLPVLITFASMYLRIFDYVIHYHYDQDWEQMTTYYPSQMIVRIVWYVIFAASFLIWTVISPIEHLEPEKDIISGKKKWYIFIVLEYTLFAFIYIGNIALFSRQVGYLFILIIEIGILALLFWQRKYIICLSRKGRKRKVHKGIFGGLIAYDYVLITIGFFSIIISVLALGKGYLGILELSSMLLGAAIFFLLLMVYWVFGTSDRKQRRQRIISLAIFIIAGISGVMIIPGINAWGYVGMNICCFFAELSLLAMWIFEISKDKHVIVK